MPVESSKDESEFNKTSESSVRLTRYRETAKPSGDYLSQDFKKRIANRE
jgi:hypothetical protein